MSRSTRFRDIGIGNCCWSGDISRTHLSLGRAAILRANGSEVTLRSARNSIQAASAEIRDSSRRDYLPRALNALGEVCIHLRHFVDAEAALQESLEIAQAAGMRMLEAERGFGDVYCDV